LILDLAAAREFDKGYGISDLAATRERPSVN
jgi:hypothetical protein